MKPNRFPAIVAAAASATLIASAGLAETTDAQAKANMLGLIESMQEIVGADDTDVSTRLRLASMLYEIGDVEQADSIMAEAAELDPNLGMFLNPIADGCEECERGTAGPDVIVGDLNGVSSYGSATAGGVEYAAFAVGTTSCNIGTQNLLWTPNTNAHPVIGQGMFRLKDGRFEQIGQSHLKHGFCALQQNLCGSCSPAGGGCPPVLGVGCSDPYTSGLNGDRDYLGPKWQVNAHTGNYPWPFFGRGVSFPSSDVLPRRLQVRTSDINAAQNPGALYFVEGQYVQPQDASFGNGNNNASYRRVTVTQSGATGNYFLSLTGSTQRTKPAIMAWGDHDSEVETVIVDVPDEGRFIVASRVYDNGDGTWDYEYAIHNLNSDRAGQALSIPVASSVAVTNIGFHDVDYHSGDGINGVTFDGTDWAGAHSGGEVSWSTQTFAQNQNANALRWATMYNFRFTADAAPEMAEATLSLFKPGTPNSVTFSVPAPGGACSLLADGNGDGRVDFGDLNMVLNNFAQSGAGLPGDLNGDGSVDFSDLNMVLNGFGEEC